MKLRFVAGVSIAMFVACGGSGGSGGSPVGPDGSSSSSSSSSGGSSSSSSGGNPTDSGPPIYDGGVDIPPGSLTIAPLPTQSGPGTFTIPGRGETAIEVAVPSPMPANPSIVISFHGTDGQPSDGIGLAGDATQFGAVVIAPRAGYRNVNHPGDVDHEPNQTGSSWNMWELDVTKNEDLLYVASLVASAKAQYNADTSRVYTFGYSNGAFMSYFTAVSLPSTIAGFAESSGGWMTDACPTRYGSTEYTASSGPAPGTAIACSTLYAAGGFPTSCIPSASNKLRPPAQKARVPFGYLAHYSSDSIVSVQWSCFLADVLGARGKIVVRFSDKDGTDNHNPPPDFVTAAWAFFANRTNVQ